MSSRIELQDELEKLLGSKNVYYQPPESVKMEYPAIVYRRSNIDNNFADDLVYRQSYFYELIVIDKNPDNVFVEAILDIPYCTFDRHYKADNLNHYVFTLFH